MRRDETMLFECRCCGRALMLYASRSLGVCGECRREIDDLVCSLMDGGGLHYWTYVVPVNRLRGMF